MSRRYCYLTGAVALYAHIPQHNAAWSGALAPAPAPARNTRRSQLVPILESSSSSEEEPSVNEEITQEIEFLQQQLSLIEAIEQRNESQLDSFVDFQDQWDSLEEEERQLLQSKVELEDRLEQLTSELVNM